ncbi:BA14K family protein [Microvirga massiliensis]|uniref:BA14K family protein n=1 Tax=Microvirga massiliensis TaxID=1033741 RepID=UPI00062BD109|nr:BA14K family protein [Microvirga massiliensis]
MRKITASLLALGMLGASLSPVGAAPMGTLPGGKAIPDLTRVYPGESYAQWRHRHYHGPRYHGPRYYGPRYYHRDRSGDALAAGALGLAAGALVGSAIASQARPALPPPPAAVDPQLAAYCARKYRSFDPVTGTYLAYSGERIVCTY